MRIVIALGGNALLQRGEPLDVDVQRHNVRRACAAVAPLASLPTEILSCPAEPPSSAPPR